MRSTIPIDIQTEVLLRTKRRCCLCFGLDLDDREKQGQIAHLDKDRNNNSPSNLAFLCLAHHDRYDSSTSQSKGLSRKEVLAYQAKLIDYIAGKMIEKLKVPENDDYSKVELEEALKFYSGTHRSQAIVMLLAESSRSLESLTEKIPPYDAEWIESILEGVVYSGWARHSPTDYKKYEITLNGKRMLEVLRTLPKSLKESAWNEIWAP